MYNTKEIADAIAASRKVADVQGAPTLDAFIEILQKISKDYKFEHGRPLGVIAVKPPSEFREFSNKAVVPVLSVATADDHLLISWNTVDNLS
jgi:hypothetical protein